jgi:hypothetical protein
MRRILLITIGSLLGLCIVCVGLGYFVALPKVQNAFANEFEHSVGTVVAQQITLPPTSPGTYVVTDDQLTAGLKGEVNGSTGTGIDKIAARISPDKIQIVLDSDRGDATFDLQVAAENGKFVVKDVAMSDSALRFFLPKDKLKKAVEKGVNQALAAQHLQVSAIQLAQGKLTLVTAPAAT